MASRWNMGPRPGAVLALALLPTTAAAFDGLSYSFPGADRALRLALLNASLTVQAEREGATDPQDLVAAARADYGRLLSALYEQGYYGGTIHILIDGHEVADIPPTDLLPRIGKIAIAVTPGPRFTFGQARMKPYAPGTHLPPDYRDGQIARSTAIADAATAGVDGWRALGYAKASVSGQTIVADHGTRRIDAEILLDHGPKLTFGTLSISGNRHISDKRVARIAGYHPGQTFDPDQLDKMQERLRETGIFRSVTVSEADQPDGDSLPISLTLAEEAPRRLGFGAEASSADGLNLSAFWLHRNLFGGGERLRFDLAANGVGANDLDTSYGLGVRLERPATPVADSTAFITANATQSQVFGQDLSSLSFGLGLTRTFSDTLSAEASISYGASSISDTGFSDDYRVLALPLSVEWDRRDSLLMPTKGSYILAGLTPFYGFGGTDSGAQVKLDGRLYRSVGAEDRVTLAGRLQIGTVAGADLLDAPPDYLFYSGGGGTVRGHPYQSLGVTVTRPPGVTVQSGGSSFVGVSGEIRARFTDTIGGAAFYDAGFVSDQSFFGGHGEWQAGAGLGLRYDTGFGPVRLDIAAPVSGSTGEGVQVYVGIGQAF